MTAGRTRHSRPRVCENGNIMSGLLKRIRSGDAAWTLVIIGYVILLTLQVNWHPFELYPGWDMFWGGPLMAGKLVSLRYAVQGSALPAISPYVGFGWSLTGDTTVPVSFLSPPNLLILAFPPDVVLMLRTMIFLVVGGIGAYQFLKLVTTARLVSLLGGLAYISLPFVVSMN